MSIVPFEEVEGEQQPVKAWLAQLRSQLGKEFDLSGIIYPEWLLVHDIWLQGVIKP